MGKTDLAKPTLLGKRKHPLNKTLINTHAFDLNEGAVNLPNALIGLVAVLVAYDTIRRLYARRVGLLAASIKGTSRLI